MAYYKCGRIYTTQNSNVVVDTASGAVANFNTSLALPLKSLKADVNAVQDLHGYDHPWVGGAGKNLCPPVTIGIGYDNNAGRAMTSDMQAVSAKFPFDKDKTYTFTKNCDVNFMLFAWDSEGNFVGRASGTNISLRVFNKSVFTSGNGTKDFNSITQIAIKFYQSSGQDINDVANAEYQVELGNTATAYKPYENICPIEGRNAITPNVNGTTEVINLGGTYYGGHFTQDKDGHRQFEVTKGYVDLATYNGRVNKLGSGDSVYFRFDNVLPYPKYGSIVCDKFSRVSILTSTNFVGVSIIAKPSGLDHSTIAFRPENPSTYTETTILDYIQSLGSLVVVYELAEPYTIDLPDGEPIITIAGTNNIWVDSGDTSLQFRKIG